MMETKDETGMPPRVWLKSWRVKLGKSWHHTCHLKPHPGDQEYLSLQEHESTLAQAKATARAEGWNDAVKQFKIYGTDGCSSCEGGRVTLFIANQKCTQCDPASYERKAARASGASKGGGT